MPVEIGSFDVIIGMDWFEGHRTAPKRIFVVPRFKSISKKDSHTSFVAHVTTKEMEDKSEKKRLKDVSMFSRLPEVFLRLAGFPRLDKWSSNRFGTWCCTCRHGHLIDRTPSEIKELSEQQKELSDKGLKRP
ncbi:hypothetical protein Tco_0580800 [Tanacetum coccineum]